MQFGTDKQTIKDLNIFSTSTNDSNVFSVYNKTQTKGGRNKLEQFFVNPTNSVEILKNRQSTILFFIDNQISYQPDNAMLDFIEHYLSQNTAILNDNYVDALYTQVKNYFSPTNAYYVITRGIDYIGHLIKQFIDFLKLANQKEYPSFIQNLHESLNSLLQHKDIEKFLKINELKFQHISHYDNLFRKKHASAIRQLVEYAYELDAYYSLARVCKEYKLCFPEFKNADKPILSIKELYHPLIDNPVKNSIEFKHGKNFCFASGANMSGKSTFLKALGLCVYLAHLGFPVPASHMCVSPFNGLYSTINLPDDMHKGYSHYYNEVRRVKDVALHIRKRGRIFVIFDELFRGTNVKDAFDATFFVSRGFAKIKDSMFIISTHITEVGEKLKPLDSVVFKCFTASMVNDQPFYTYQLTDGISDDKLGLIILKREQILEILDKLA